MDNHIITILEKFEKPAENSLKEKQCLICLEPFDLESNTFVQLPCKCSSPVYHTDCIVKLLNSGDNKNFCPHCKTNYENPVKIKVAANQVASNQVVPYNVPNIQLEPEINYEQVKNFTGILILHTLSNSFMNVINVVITRSSPGYDISVELQVLMVFYFFKIFFNYVIFVYSKNNIEKIEDSLLCSYTFQIVLLGLSVYALTKLNNDNRLITLIVINTIFSFGDFIYRKILENRTINTVHATE
jgi:hypothetical protein